MNFMRRNGARRMGTTTVEVALSLPIFLLFVLGILEYGRYFFMDNVAKHAAREGARFAVVNTHQKTTADVIAFVKDRLSSASNSIDALDVSVFEADPLTGAELDDWRNAAFGEMIAVRVQGNYRPVISGFLFLPESFPVTHMSMMTSEAN